MSLNPNFPTLVIPVNPNVFILCAVLLVGYSRVDAFSAALASSPSPEPIPALPAITHMGDVEELILTMTNDIRQQNGLKRLRRETTLRTIARRHCDDMISRRFFAHVNPDGQDAADRIAVQHRRLIGGVGENIWQYASMLETNGSREPAYIQLSPRQIAKQAIEGWMNSPGHRENMLRPQFTHLGVGVSIVKGMVTATQNFASVRAYTNMALPIRIGTSGMMKLETTSYPASQPRAIQYDYWLEKKQERVGETLPITSSRVTVKQGIYRIRFYFPVPEGFMVYMGPRVEIR